MVMDVALLNLPRKLHGFVNQDLKDKIVQPQQNVQVMDCVTAMEFVIEACASVLMVFLVLHVSKLLVVLMIAMAKENAKEENVFVILVRVVMHARKIYHALPIVVVMDLVIGEIVSVMLNILDLHVVKKRNAQRVWRARPVQIAAFVYKDNAGVSRGTAEKRAVPLFPWA